MKSPHKVLLVGPLPPPRGGATLSFEAIAEAWRGLPGTSVSVLNTAPPAAKTTRQLRWTDYFRGIRIARQLWRETPKSDAVCLYVTNGFFFRYGRFLTWLRGRFGIPIFVSFFGSSLYDDLMMLPIAKRQTLVGSLKAMDQVVVETAYLQQRMAGLGLSNVMAIPGYRKVEWESLPVPVGAQQPLRLVFLSQIRREKGIMELLQALQSVGGHPDLSCDVYGSVDPEVSEEFGELIARTPGVQFKGVATGNIPALLAHYDFLVLPTWHAGEGHPGVVIEAMVAGIPVLTTRHKALPELIEHGVNGILIEPKSVPDLVRAIEYARDNRDALRSMGEAHRQRLRQHDVARAAGVWYDLVHRFVGS